MLVEQFLSLFDGLKATGSHKWLARCPAHEDRHASLSIRECEDGRILIYDFAGCSAGAILKSMGLGLSDLYAQPLAHYLAPVRRGYSARELLEIISHEACVVWILLEQVPRGTFSNLGLERLTTACERIAKARTHASGY